MGMIRRMNKEIMQRRLDSQLGEHLDQSDCAIFLVLARSFWYRKFT